MLHIHSEILRFALLAVSLIGIALFAMPLAVHIVNIGNLFGLFASILLLCFTVWNGRISALLDAVWTKKAGRITLIVCGVLIAAGILYCLILSICMIHAANKKTQNPPQAIIVLGCKVNGTVPSLMLSRRIAAAYDVLQKNPELICVVSGGQGSNEAISEAECMKNELTKRGISEDRILTEEQSASTSENLRFSKAILENAGITGDVYLATDSYHQFRAQLLAKNEGYSACYPVTPYTSWYLVPTYWVREWFGLTHAFFFGS